jgi:citrate lyase subunit beta/citryl-CoA lyase
MSTPMASRPIPRTYLFVPGNRPERFAKALASPADAVVLDLEDAVAVDDKSSARESVGAQLAGMSTDARRRVVVRINDSASGWFSMDLRTLLQSGGAQVMLPKAESPTEIAALRAALPDADVLALIETARGVATVDEIAAASGVSRLVFGTLDFALDLDLETSSGDEGLAYAAGRIAIASRAAGLAPPVAGVTPQLDDEAALLADLAKARRFGFGAKLCIHPKQIDPIHRALQPSAAAVDWATRVLRAEAASPGAAKLDGRMVDRPVVAQAERILMRSAH